jgi:DNA-binding MarR family transcriptional regulator
MWRACSRHRILVVGLVPGGRSLHGQILSRRCLITQVHDRYARTMAAIRLTETELRAWQALLHAHHELVRRLDEELRETHGVTFAEYDVLLRLARAPGRALRMGDLADRVLLSPSGITRLVDRMIAKKLLCRETDPTDGRVALATLTEEGLRLVRLAARTHLRGIRQHFSGRLSDPQLRAVASALETIVGPHTPH